jgi:hypothetical protein
VCRLLDRAQTTELRNSLGLGMFFAFYYPAKGKPFFFFPTMLELAIAFSLRLTVEDRVFHAAKLKTRKAESTYCFICRLKKMKTAGAFGDPIRQDLIPGLFLMAR